MAIHVVQGERELIADCRSLARFELRGIPPMVAGAARIRVTFAVVPTACCRWRRVSKRPGCRQASRSNRRTARPDDDEITGMLRASIDHARDDMDARRLVEEKVEAQRVIEALNAALARDGDELLSADERAGVQQALGMPALATAESSQDAREVEAAIKQLEKDCEFYNRTTHEQWYPQSHGRPPGGRVRAGGRPRGRGSRCPKSYFCRTTISPERRRESTPSRGRRSATRHWPTTSKSEHACEKSCACTTCHDRA